MSPLAELLTPKKSVLQRVVDVLVECQSEDGFAWVTRAYIAQEAGCSLMAAPRALRQLEQAGVIARRGLVNEVGLSRGIQCELLAPELRALAKPGHQATLMRCSPSDD